NRQTFSYQSLSKLRGIQEKPAIGVCCYNCSFLLERERQETASSPRTSASHFPFQGQGEKLGDQQQNTSCCVKTSHHYH
uniref:Uncharacterized protein n=1 Tax=Anopheles albimanus TaxID=7167 RepID=A0A182FX00_ANOAL